MNTMYRSKKLSRKGWRRSLWNQTLHKQHWRSVANSVAAITTNATQGLGTLVAVQPLFVGTPSLTTMFDTVTGGLQVADTGVSVPSFDNGDLVIRGGRIGITFNVEDAVTDEIGISVLTVWTCKNPDFTKLPGSVPWGTTVDAAPDFAEFGKVLRKQDFVLSNSVPAITIERRLKVQKIDQNDFSEGGLQIVFVVLATNLSNSAAVACNAIIYHDMSFVGDD